MATNDRRQPLNPIAVSSPVASSSRTTSLNDRLNTNYVDVGADNNSILANTTRIITGFVGNFVTPRQLLVVLRILKAITFCFLVLTVAADLMYIVFLEILAPKDVRLIVGGSRDLIIRIYGLALAAMAIFIELDITTVVKAFYGFKGFIPRALLLFFVSAITGSHPMKSSKKQVNDDYFKYRNDDEYVSLSSDIPSSAVMFQIVTSFIL